MGQTQGGSGDFGGETNGGGSPWQKLLMGGLKGGLSGYSDMQKQNALLRQGGGSQIQTAPTQMVSADFFQPQRRGANNLSFYGDSNG